MVHACVQRNLGAAFWDTIASTSTYGGRCVVITDIWPRIFPGYVNPLYTTMSSHSSCLVARYMPCDLGSLVHDAAAAVGVASAADVAGVTPEAARSRVRKTCFRRRPPPLLRLIPSRPLALPASSSPSPSPPRASSAISCAGSGTRPATERMR